MTEHYGRPPLVIGSHRVSWIGDRVWLFGPGGYLATFLLSDYDGSEAKAVEAAVRLGRERSDTQAVLSIVEKTEG